MNNDLISRAALKTAIEDRIDNIPASEYDEGWNNAIYAVIDEIDNAPTERPSLIVKDMTEEDIKNFAVIYQRATSKGLLSPALLNDAKVVFQERPQEEWLSNGEIFKRVFGVYATEVWSMSERNFLEWLNMEVRNDDKRGY